MKGPVLPISRQVNETLSVQIVKIFAKWNWISTNPLSNTRNLEQQLWERLAHLTPLSKYVRFVTRCPVELKNSTNRNRNNWICSMICNNAGSINMVQMNSLVHLPLRNSSRH